MHAYQDLKPALHVKGDYEAAPLSHLEQGSQRATGVIIGAPIC